MNKLVLLVLPIFVAVDPQASRVTVNGPPKPLADVAADLGRQANVRIDVERATGAPVGLNLTAVPFWEAVEQLAAKSNQRLAVGLQGPRVVVGGGPYRSVPTAVYGPFRFAAHHIRTSVDLDAGQSTTDVQIDAVWEPKFKAFYAEVPARSVTAIDEHGRALSLAGDGSGKMEVRASGQELTVRLANVPRTVMQIAQLKGKLTL